MDQHRCTAPSCEFIASSVRIAQSHKEQTGHTLKLVGSVPLYSGSTGSNASPVPTGAFGQAVLTDSPYRYFLTFTDDFILWEKQTWSPKSSKIPARVEHDQISYSKVKSITYEEVDLGPTSLFNRERKVWKGWYIILNNGMRFPVIDDGKNGRMIDGIKERIKLNARGTNDSPSPIPTREVIKEFREVVLIQCRSCGARYQQGTLRCLTCGANL